MKILGAERVTVTRYNAVTYTNHRPVTSVDSTFVIDISIQPMSGDELQLLNYGDRTQKTRKGYTDTLLRTVDEVNEKPADELSIDSVNYQVHTVERQRSVRPHYRVILVAKQ